MVKSKSLNIDMALKYNKFTLTCLTLFEENLFDQHLDFFATCFDERKASLKPKQIKNKAWRKKSTQL